MSWNWNFSECNEWASQELTLRKWQGSFICLWMYINHLKQIKAVLHRFGYSTAFAIFNPLSKLYFIILILHQSKTQLHSGTVEPFSLKEFMHLFPFHSSVSFLCSLLSFGIIHSIEYVELLSKIWLIGSNKTDVL
jgi:hypothetical protein